MLRRANIFLAVIALCALTLFAEQPKLPKAESVRDKLGILSLSRNEFPEVFTENQNTGLDYLEMIAQQGTLVTNLEANAQYQSLAKDRPGYLTLKFELGGEGDGKTVDAQALEQWRKRLLESLAGLPDSSPSDSLNQKIAEASQGAGQAQGFLTGLINTLPKERRGDVFKLSEEEKIRTLGRELAPDLIDAGFQGERYGITGPLSKDKALGHVRRLLHARDKVKSLFPLQWILESGGKTLSKEELRKNVESLTPDQIIKLTERKATSSAEETAQRDLRDLVKRPQDKPTPLRSLTLKEAPPYAAIYRGCAGGDCSSQYNSLYPWSPMERVFYIFGHHGDLKGYLSATIVDDAKAEKPRSLYVHTIAGRRLSEADTTLVLQGLDRVKDRFAANRILLPPQNRLNGLINYDEIRNAMKEASKNSPNRSLRYLDSDVRRLIDSSPAITMDYDKEKSNPYAVEYRPQPTLPSLNVESAERKLPPIELKPMNAQDALLTALDLKMGGETQLANAISREVPKGRELLDTIARKLRNLNHRNMATFRRELDQLFKKQNILLPKDYFDRRAHFLDEGVMNASDSMSPENRNDTVRRVIRLFSHEVEHADGIADFETAQALVKRKAKEFGEHEGFRRFIAQTYLSSEHPANYDALQTLLDAGALPGFFDLAIERSIAGDAKTRENIQDTLSNVGYDSKALHDAMVAHPDLAGNARRDLAKLVFNGSDAHKRTLVNFHRERLSDPDPQKQRVAIEMFDGFFGVYHTLTTKFHGELRHAIGEKVESPDSVGEAASRFLMNHMRIEDHEIREKLLKATADENPVTRANAFRAIGSKYIYWTSAADPRREEMHALVEKGLNDPDPRVHGALLEGLPRHGGGSDGIVPAIIRTLESKDPKVQSQARDHLNKRGALPKENLLALSELAKIGNEAAMEVLVDHYFKSRASTALVAIAADENTPFEFRAKAMDVVNSHLNSMTFVANQVPENLLSNLVKILELPGPELRQTAAEVLRKAYHVHGNAELTPLRRLAVSKDPELRRLALTALKSPQVQAKPKDNPFYQGLLDENPAIRAIAAEGFKDTIQTQVPETVSALITLLKDPDQNVREKAATSLTTMRAAPKEHWRQIWEVTESGALKETAAHRILDNYAPEDVDIISEALMRGIPLNPNRLNWVDRQEHQLPKNVENALVNHLLNEPIGMHHDRIITLLKSSSHPAISPYLLARWERPDFTDVEKAELVRRLPHWDRENQEKLLRYITQHNTTREMLVMSSRATSILPHIRVDYPPLVDRLIQQLFEAKSSAQHSNAVAQLSNAEMTPEQQRRVFEHLLETSKSYGISSDHRILPRLPAVMEDLYEKVRPSHPRYVALLEFMGGNKVMTPEMDEIYSEILGSTKIAANVDRSLFNGLQHFSTIGPKTALKLAQLMGRKGLSSSKVWTAAGILKEKQVEWTPEAVQSLQNKRGEAGQYAKPVLQKIEDTLPKNQCRKLFKKAAGK